MKLYSLFYAQEFEDDEGAAVYHGTFSTHELARDCANKMMSNDFSNTIIELSPDHEAIRNYTGTTQLPLIDDLWTEFNWDDGLWQIVAVTLDVHNTGAHLL